ncbi:hypothetical protein U4E84_01660 [Halorubrum sp. AD140]|uniref:hypothetical protein n=1 Tax=Halorubrum sp. AD140 TaxID=3050073 RepID=UPI002ACC492E|nr:hypothetical protein [Halorubrum sp. AD140]MDZ5810061.1 hypothetical protein [Halorubrum sp. AD140]
MATTPIGVAFSAITRTVASLAPLGQLLFWGVVVFAGAAALGYDPIGIVESWVRSYVRGVVGV